MSATCVIFRLGDRRFAMRVEQVERVLRAIEISQFPNDPSELTGVINVEGEIVEVVNFRRALGYPDRVLELQDHIIITKSGEQKVAFVVDAVEDVMHCNEDQLAAPGEQSGSEMLKLDDGMLMLFGYDEVAASSRKRQLQPA